MSERLKKKIINPLKRLNVDGAILLVNLKEPQLEMVKLFEGFFIREKIPYFIVGNKVDQVKRSNKDLKGLVNVKAYVSAITGQGMKEIESLIKEFFGKNKRIIVMGEYNSGKSTFISFLTGRRIKTGRLLGITLEYTPYPYKDDTLIDSPGFLFDIGKNDPSIDFEGTKSLSEQVDRVRDELIKSIDNTHRSQKKASYCDDQ